MDLDFPLDEVIPYITIVGGKHVQTSKNVERRVGYLVVGTGYLGSFGEDELARARLLVFKIEHVEKETSSANNKQGKPTSTPKLNLICQIPPKGPVSAVACLDGKILAATGNIPCTVKLFEMNKRDDEMGLIPVGYYAAPTCVVSINVIKDEFILLGDMNKSIFFLRWRYKQFSVLGKNPFEALRVLSTEFLCDETRLCLCATDENCNLSVWHFDDQHGIQIRGELCIGDRVGKMKPRRVIPLPKVVASSSSSAGSSSTSNGGVDSFLSASFYSQTDGNSTPVNRDRWSLTMAGWGGSISSLLPIEEKIYRRLDLLYIAMVSSNFVVKNCGLNPLSYAEFRPGFGSIQRARKGNIIDGRLVYKFLSLDKVAQRKLAFSIGSTVETVYDALLEIDLMIVF